MERSPAKSIPELHDDIENNPASCALIEFCNRLYDIDEERLNAYISKHFAVRGLADASRIFYRNKKLFGTALRLSERGGGPKRESMSDRDFVQDWLEYEENWVCGWKDYGGQDAESVIVAGSIAERIFKAIAGRGLAAAKKRINNSPHPKFAEFLLESAIDDCLERIEKILHANYGKQIRKANEIAKSRMKQKTLLK